MTRQFELPSEDELVQAEAHQEEHGVIADVAHLVDGHATRVRAARDLVRVHREAGMLLSFSPADELQAAALIEALRERVQELEGQLGSTDPAGEWVWDGGIV